MNDELTRVLIVDDHPLFRRGVRQLLEMDPSLKCVGEAADGETAVRLACEHEPDLVLLDLQMEGMDGLATLRALREHDRHARVIMLTVSDSEDDVMAALRDGADGYLLKDMEPEDMLERIREAATGKLVLSDRLTRLLATAITGGRDHDSARLAELTSREREVLGGIAQGLSNKLIARRLDVSEGTVKVHVKNLLRKLGLKSRVQAAVWAVNQGLR
ncbi:Nitrate/nitrite response regulator protein NarL [wastewater metagenome]|uniref:Nitrate/nitrite response regulator protein NarL n=2 Tax=unclassified sequences TaxID=12908 RepID=A0A5B8R5R8_9ZZZZ|nr:MULTISPECIES: two-component system response regulator NarL [Arhodomonas]MCS4502668.1 two-component system response regulator NarL [Arhodomonas aquaeolei]QEA03851.1 nitrate/nitrite response regulator protein NarL [uncultured organism]